MITTTIFPGRYIQGADAMKRLGEELARLGKKGMLICDPFVLDRILPAYLPGIKEKIDVQAVRFGGECTDEEIDRLTKQAREAGCDLLAGIGGGKTFDTAKAVAYQLQVPVAIIPTIASTDAPCSALSVIYTSEGQFKRYLVLRRNPDLVLLDTRVIARAPVRFLVSGMGDALATWFEAESAMNKYAANLTGDVGSLTAYSLAHLCYQTLLEYGVAAKASSEAGAVTPALEHIIEANTLLSGLGFESGGLAAAHAIHNGLTVLEQAHSFYHGEKVAFGTLASLFLTDKPLEVIDEVYSFCEKVGLPTTLADLNLEGVSDQELLRVGEATCVEGETVHNEAVPVTPESVAAALKAADSYGRLRKDG